MPKIVLASSSPRRKELLETIGLKFEVAPGNGDETVDAQIDPHQVARSIALKKAQSVAPGYADAIVIAADTFGVIDNLVVGKPCTEDGAREMLRTLQGREHSVITGFCILNTATGKIVTRSVETKVCIRSLTSAEIDAYVKSGEPLDKAGAYAIQGLGAVIVERIEGDYSNVVGLPLSALTVALKEFGINVL